MRIWSTASRCAPRSSFARTPSCDGRASGTPRRCGTCTRASPSDLHDSVGASLSRIAILSDLALRESEASATATTGALTKIGDNARAVIDEMSDAVWFVDPKMEDVQQMVVRLRIVAAALFESNGTDWDIDAAPELLPLTLTPDQRRHLFLILKEALTNVHRHAHATVVRVAIRRRTRAFARWSTTTARACSRSAPVRVTATAWPTCRSGRASSPGRCRSNRDRPLPARGSSSTCRCAVTCRFGLLGHCKPGACRPFARP